MRLLYVLQFPPSVTGNSQMSSLCNNSSVFKSCLFSNLHLNFETQKYYAFNQSITLKFYLCFPCMYLQLHSDITQSITFSNFVWSANCMHDAINEPRLFPNFVLSANCMYGAINQSEVCHNFSPVSVLKLMASKIGHP